MGSAVTSFNASSWKTVWALFKGGIAPKVNEDVRFCFDVYLGIMYVSGPDIAMTLDSYGKSSSTSTSFGSGTGVAYGIGGSVELSRHLTIGLHYINGSALLSPYDSSDLTPVANLRAVAGYTFAL